MENCVYIYIEHSHNKYLIYLDRHVAYSIFNGDIWGYRIIFFLVWTLMHKSQPMSESICTLETIVVQKPNH